jgi:hypothetical protein
MPVYRRIDSGTLWPRKHDEGSSIDGRFVGRETANWTVWRADLPPNSGTQR